MIFIKRKIKTKEKDFSNTISSDMMNEEEVNSSK